VASKSKVHVVVGHTTVMAELLFFGVADGAGEPPEQALAGLTRRIGSLALKARRP
jgi:selenocysteine-specific elongation factor